MTHAYLINSVRLPIGKFGGQFKAVLPETLAATLLNRFADTQIDGVYLGNVVSGGGNVARRAVLASQLPIKTPAVTIDQQCASGLAAINLTANAIAAGTADCLLAGGVESCSRAPWQIQRPTRLYGPAPQILPRAPLSPASVGDPDMGPACEKLAAELHITRAAQDAYALQSQIRYQNAREKLAAGIVAFNGITQDESPRPDTNAQTLAHLRPAFSENGTITAGNASPLNDGAAVVQLASRQWCQQHGVTPRFRFCASVSVGVLPARFGLGPVPAVAALLKQQHLTIAQIDRIELNEAFAAQVLACLEQTHWPLERINVFGGAIAFGHPFGATGAILLQHLLLALDDCNGHFGIVTMCVGGGMGIAALIERL